MLSPSHWIVIYETRTLDKADDFNDLKETYGSLLKAVDWKDLPTRSSIQVIGPEAHGKSILVKFISQDFTRKSPIIVIDNFLDSFGNSWPTSYGLFISFLHQPLSKRPSLFRSARCLVAKNLCREHWSEEFLRTLLAAILRDPSMLDLLVVIYDFEDWPVEIQSWFKSLGSFLESCGPIYAFLASSRRLIKGFTPTEPLVLNLEQNYI